MELQHRDNDSREYVKSLVPKEVKHEQASRGVFPEGTYMRYSLGKIKALQAKGL